MRRAIPVLFCVALALSAGSLAADPIISLVNGELTATAIVQSGTMQLDVRGNVLLSVADPDLNLPPSGLSVFDCRYGTNPCGSSLVFGNQFLAGTTVLTPSTGDSAVIYFDFSHAQLAGPLLTIPTLIAINHNGIPTGGTTDPILYSLLNASPIPYNFGFVTSANFGEAVLAQYNLVSVASQVPEPSSFILLSAGCIFLYGCRRRHFQ